MMDEEKWMLDEDLEKKLNFLLFIDSSPDLFICNYFDNIRNSIDVDAENALQWIQKMDKPDAAEQEAQVHHIRLCYFRFLKKIEDSRVEQLTSKSQTFAELTTKVDQFLASTEDEASIKNLYFEILFEIIEETNSRRAKILGNQSIYYENSYDPARVGILKCFY